MYVFILDCSPDKNVLHFLFFKHLKWNLFKNELISTLSYHIPTFFHSMSHLGEYAALPSTQGVQDRSLDHFLSSAPMASHFYHLNSSCISPLYPSQPSLHEFRLLQLLNRIRAAASWQLSLPPILTPPTQSSTPIYWAPNCMAVTRVHNPLFTESMF